MDWRKKAATHSLTPHWIEACTYHDYETALAVAAMIGVAAQPLRNLSREGWTIVVDYEGEPFYTTT